MKKVIGLLLIFLIGLISCKENKCIRTEPFKGFMIDAPRTVENMEYYYKFIDFCKEWGFNAVIFRITDDEGSALKFVKHPELITHEGAFTADELKKMVEYAQSKGIEMIPEVESFGHTRYITKSPRYKFLNDAPREAWNNAICPVSDTTLMLMKDLYTEVAAIFPSCYFHIGCDEILWGGTEMSKKALQTRNKNQIWAGYVNTLNSYVKELGKKTIIWGDVPIRDEKELADLLDKDMILMDWNYWDCDENKIDSTAKAVINKGFQLIGAPAVNWWMWGPRVGEYQFENIKAFVNVYNRIKNPSNLGIIITHWVPLRYIQNCQWDSYAVAGEILNNPGDYDFMKGIEKFFPVYFGAAWNAQWEKMFRTLYKKTPKHRDECQEQQGWGITPFWPWMDSSHVRNIAEEEKPLEPVFDSLYIEFYNLSNKITQHQNDYNELLLTLEYLRHNYYRNNAIWQFAQSGKINEKTARQLLSEIVAKDKSLLNRMDSVWKQGRSGVMNKDHVWKFPSAVKYAEDLSKNPKILVDIIKKCNKQ